MEKSTFGERQEKIFLAIVSLFWFAQYVYIPYQTPFLSGIGIASGIIGMIVGAYGISQLLLRFPVGLMADYSGKQKGFITIGALAAGAASLVRIISYNGAGFLIANLISGFASSMWICFMVFYTGHYDDDRQQEATSRIVMFNNLGMLLGFISSTVTYQMIGMRGICFFSVLAGAAAFLLSLTVHEDQETHAGEITVKELTKVCLGKRLWFFSFVALIQQGVQLTTAMSFTSQMLKNAGAGDGLVGLSSIVYMISSVSFAALASSGFCKKKGPSFWIPAVLGVVAAYCILVPLAGSVGVIFVLQILPGMSTGILFSFATSEAMKGVPREKKSTAMGMFQAVYAIGMTCFPIMTGNIASQFDMKTGYFVLAAIAAAGSAASIFYYMREKSAENDESTVKETEYA